MTRHGERTLNALCDRRLQAFIDQRRRRVPYDKVESLMNVSVHPILGEVDVTEWNNRRGVKVLRAAKKTRGAQRVADLGKLLRSLVTLAHRKPARLPPGDDPLEDVEFQIKALSPGEDVVFVPMTQRRSTEQVDSLASAMLERGLGARAHLAARPGGTRRDRSWLGLAPTPGPGQVWLPVRARRSASW